MVANKIKYFFHILSRAAGSFTIDLTEYQYKQLIAKFKQDLELNEKLYKDGKTNMHIGYKYKYDELKFYNETTNTYFDEGVTYILTKLELK